MKKWYDTKKKKVFLIALVLIWLMGILYAFFYPSLYERQAKERKADEKMAEQIEAIQSACICVIGATEREDGFGYGVGASGVIFYQDEGYYYALTAYHVVNSSDRDYYLIRTVLDPSMSEFREEYPQRRPVEYYQQFPRAEVMYESETSDLAIIRFESDYELSVLPVAEQTSQKGEWIAAIGTDGENNLPFQITYGKIKSDSLYPFHTDDGQTDNQVIRHTAYETGGFSGGPVINGQSQIVGINIGGATDLFGRFRYGVMIPCEQVQKFLLEWEAH